jgi:hypothetical protein
MPRHGNDLPLWKDLRTFRKVLSLTSDKQVDSDGEDIQSISGGFRFANFGFEAQIDGNLVRQPAMAFQLPLDNRVNCPGLVTAILGPFGNRFAACLKFRLDNECVHLQ